MKVKFFSNRLNETEGITMYDVPTFPLRLPLRKKYQS